MASGRAASWVVMMSACGSLQAVLEELGKFVERNQLHPVIQVDVPGVRDDVKLLGFACQSESLFTELTRVGVLASDKEHRAWGDGLDVRKWIEVHELDIAGQRRVGGQLRAR